MARADQSDTGARPRRSRRTGKAKTAGETEPTGDGSGPDSGEKPSFEVALDRLEKVVDRLEGGELELETALECFEDGVRLTRQCAEQLDAAERRIEILMKEGDEWVARPFADGSETESPESDATESWED